MQIKKYANDMREAILLLR